MKKTMYEKDYRYALTINCKTQHDTLKYKNSRAYEEIKYCINRIVKRMKDTANIMLIPEISRGGRWHWHGILIIKEVYKFHAMVLPFLPTVCQYEIDTIDDPDVWRDYIYKDEDIMRPAIELQGLTYEITNETPSLA